MSEFWKPLCRNDWSIPYVVRVEGIRVGIMFFIGPFSQVLLALRSLVSSVVGIVFLSCSQIGGSSSPMDLATMDVSDTMISRYDTTKYVRA